MTYTELLEAAHANDFTRSTRDLLTCVAIDMVGFLDRWPGLERELPQITDSLYSLGTLMDLPTSMQASPEQCFDLEGFGHFKECYTFSPNFVIKFCAERNPTAEESKLLDDAWANDMDDLFLPTKYYELPHALFSDSLEKDDEEAEIWSDEEDDWVENQDWHDDTILTNICIQPRVLSAEIKYSSPDMPNIYDKPVDAECGTSAKAWDHTRKELGIPESENRYDWQGLNGVCLLWAIDFKNRYGLTRLKKFAEFCSLYHVWDLHSENVGYTLPGADGIAYPVILDWMSRQTIPNSVLFHKFPAV